ncbi:zinc-binding dehydrogenase [Actinopolymorpha sp. B17G11]|uniref:zinc-dependent alcohol dehydrogenase n=1 Tax=Actinopolymorpha sp. B17G11 TaxID=3160861 RepID=UPI0032E49B8D
MKSVAITGPRSCEIRDVPEPKAARDVVKIRILSAPMCTEVQTYAAGGPADVLGHEAAGEVVDAADSSRVRAGDRVVVMPQYACGNCQLCLSGEHIHCPHQRDVLAATGSETGTATYAQYCLKPDWLLFPIPVDLSYDEAAMACCGLGPTFNACERLRVDALDTVLVSGCGAVGLGAVVNARLRGARVLALEPHPYRAELARKLGAEAVIDPRDDDAADQVSARTSGRGPDASIETSSAPTAPAFLAAVTRRRGRIGSVGWGGPVEAARLVERGLEFHGVWHWNHLRDGDRMVETIRRARPVLRHLVTHAFPMDGVRDAWELQLTAQCGKVVLHPWETPAAPAAAEDSDR